MIRYLIKNNLKLMLRSAGNIFIYVFAPIVVSVVLISAFTSLMESYEVPDEFTVGYYIEEGSSYEVLVPSLKTASSDAGIIMKEYTDADPKKTINEDDLGGFVVFGSDDYTLYKMNDTRGRAAAFFLKAFFDNVFYGYSKTDIEVKRPYYIPAIDAGDYYGIIYVVYFGWCAIVCASRLLFGEKKDGIEKKYLVSGMGDAGIYLEKMIPTFLTVVICTSITALLSAICLDVKWGNPVLSLLILAVSVLAATTMGMFIYYLCESNVVTIIITFILVWTMGFIGGSFETYMFSSFSDSLKNICPIYHINRALTEMSVMGRSDYAASAIIYCCLLSAVFAAATLLTAKIKRRVKA